MVFDVRNDMGAYEKKYFINNLRKLYLSNFCWGFANVLKFKILMFS